MELEQLLSDIEALGASSLGKIQRGIPLTIEEREGFALFVATLILRVPNYRNSFKEGEKRFIRGQMQAITLDAEIFEEFTKHMEETTDFDAEGQYDELRNGIRSALPDIQLDEQSSLRDLLKMESITPMVLNMRWRFARAKGARKFVTSDNPVAVFHPENGERGMYGLGLRLPNTEVTLPLTRDCALVASWGPPPTLSVEEINERTVIVATRYVYASEDSTSIARLTRQYPDSAPRMTVRTAIEQTASGDVELTVETSALRRTDG